MSAGFLLAAALSFKLSKEDSSHVALFRNIYMREPGCLCSQIDDGYCCEPCRTRQGTSHAETIDGLVLANELRIRRSGVRLPPGVFLAGTSIPAGWRNSPLQSQPRENLIHPEPEFHLGFLSFGLRRRHNYGVIEW